VLNVQFIDHGNCPIIDFDIDDEVATDALERAWALFDMAGAATTEVKQIIITKN
jgi:hypothetical protein